MMGYKHYHMDYEGSSFYETVRAPMIQTHGLRGISMKELKQQAYQEQ